MTKTYIYIYICIYCIYNGMSELAVIRLSKSYYLLNFRVLIDFYWYSTDFYWYSIDFYWLIDISHGISLDFLFFIVSSTTPSTGAPRKPRRRAGVRVRRRREHAQKRREVRGAAGPECFTHPFWMCSGSSSVVSASCFSASCLLLFSNLFVSMILRT